MTSDDLFGRWAHSRVLWIALLWLSCEFWLLGPYSYFRMHDSGNNNVALLLGLEANPLNSGYWFAGAIAGFDRLASGFFTGVDRALYAVLPGWLPSQTFNIAMILVGGWSTYRLALERLWLPSACALAGALVHATLMTNLQMGVASVAFLPFLIWAVGRAVDQASGLSRWVLAAAAALAVGLSTQAHILLPFTPALLICWFVVLEPPRRFVDWLLIAMACLLMFAAQATVILALSANAPLSYRGMAFLATDPFARLALDKLDPLARWGDPGGVALAVFAVLSLAVAAFRGQRPNVRLLWLFLLIWILPSLAEAVKSLVIPFVPALSGFRLDRFSLYDSMFLGLAVAAALAPMPDAAGLSWRGRIFSWRAAALATVLLLVFAQSLRFKAHHAYEWIQQGNYVQNFASPVIADLARRAREEGEPFRVASVNMPTNVFAAYGLETIDGYVNIYSRRFREFWERVAAPRIAREGPLTSLSEVRLFHNQEMAVVEFAEFFDLDLLSLANVRYIAARNELRHSDLRVVHAPAAPWASLSLAERVRVRLGENFSGSEWIYVYENMTAQPRVFFTDPEIFADSASLLDAMTRRSVAELRRRGLLLAADAAVPMSSRAATLNAVRRSPDRIEIDVTTQDDALLAVMDNFSPFWDCRVDDRPCQPLPLYHAFIGVPVPRGSRQVVLTYRPPERLF